VSMSAGARPPLNRRARVAAAALEAGHVPDIQHEGKRFRIVCACGWSTALNWTRKHCFEAIADHQIRAGRTFLGESPAAGEIPPVNAARGVSDSTRRGA